MNLPKLLQIFLCVGVAAALNTKSVVVQLEKSSIAAETHWAHFGLASSNASAHSGRFVASRLDPAETKEAAAEAPKKYVPSAKQQMYMRPVSVTMHCVMILTVISMMLYTLLSAARNADELNGAAEPSLLTHTMSIAARTGSMAPMTCVLFVSCRMYVLAATDGLGEPEPWVKASMITTVVGFAINLTIVLLMPFISTHHSHKDEDDDNHIFANDNGDNFEDQNEDVPNPYSDNNDVFPVMHGYVFHRGFESVKYVVMALQVVGLVCIYGGVSGVASGLLFQKIEKKVSPSVSCSVLLAVVYFLSCLSLYVARHTGNIKIVHGALAAIFRARKNPMFAVMMLAARMHAMRMDPPDGMPPVWIQCCLYGIVACHTVEVLLAFYVGFAGTPRDKGTHGVYTFRLPNVGIKIVLHSLAFACYLLLACIVGNVFLTAYQEEKELSTMMKATLTLTKVYFAVMCVLTAVLLMEDIKDDTKALHLLKRTAIESCISLQLAPLLSVLFIGTRMRALQITQQEGNPQGWAQDAMISAVFAVCVQSLCCLVLPIFLAKAAERGQKQQTIDGKPVDPDADVEQEINVDEDGNIDYDTTPMIGAYAVAMVKYLALLCLHGSVITICFAIYSMTPETCMTDTKRIMTSGGSLAKALIGVLVAFFISLLLSSAKVVGTAVKVVLESCDKALLGVEITLGSAALSLFKGYVKIHDLVVHQPTEEMEWETSADGQLVGTPTGKLCDWKENYIVKIKCVNVKVNLWRLVKTLGRQFEIEQLSFVGIHANIEKPDTDTKKQNSNVEYILKHIESLGLIPEEEEEDMAATSSTPAPTEPVVEEKPVEEDKSAEPPEDIMNEKPGQKIGGIPAIILNKIEIGDIGAGVTIKKVPLVGTFSFHPTIGLLAFDNLQQTVFGGRDDLTPKETIACIIKSIAKKIFQKVVVEIPKHLAHAASGAVSGGLQKGKTMVKGAKDKCEVS